VDVVDGVSLLFEFLLKQIISSPGFLRLMAEICIGLLKTFSMPDAVAEGIADDEAEGDGQHHPYWCCLLDHAACS
jgi:hypothetical protein